MSLKAAGFQVDLEAMAEKFGIPLNPAAPEADISASPTETGNDQPDESGNGDEEESSETGKELNKKKDNKTKKIPAEAPAASVMESGELNSLLERALILADIEGRWSVMEDI